MDLPVVSYEEIPPSPRGAVQALARIGYRVEEALADVIDNSIDAAARKILVRFVYAGDIVKRVVIADDGQGMTEDNLREAMKIGADTGHETTDLGKYGTGMKTASFSQCNQLTVITRSHGQTHGRTWARREAESGWRCGVIETRAAEALMDASWMSTITESDGGRITIREGQTSKDARGATISASWGSAPAPAVYAAAVRTTTLGPLHPPPDRAI